MERVVLRQITWEITTLNDTDIISLLLLGLTTVIAIRERGLLNNLRATATELAGLRLNAKIGVRTRESKVAPLKLLLTLLLTLPERIKCRS